MHRAKSGSHLGFPSDLEDWARAKPNLVSSYTLQARRKTVFFWIFAGLKKTRHISSVFSSFKLENDGFKQQIVDNYFLETGRL